MALLTLPPRSPSSVEDLNLVARMHQCNARLGVPVAVNVELEMTERNYPVSSNISPILEKLPQVVIPADAVLHVQRAAVIAGEKGWKLAEYADARGDGNIHRVCLGDAMSDRKGGGAVYIGMALGMVE